MPVLLTVPPEMVRIPHLAGPGVTAAKYDIPALPLKVSVVEMDLTNPYIVMET